MPKVSVYNLLLEMIKHEENFGAYWIYLALMKGYLQKEDDPKRIYDVPFTDEEIAEINAMNERDVLGINRIKLYATNISDSKYALYFARTPYDAQMLHSNIYGTKPTKWHSIYNQHKYTSILHNETNEEIYLFMLKERVKKFPYYIGEVVVENSASSVTV
ncbi:hypothetical protein MKY27_14265 [Solibacillus sp. FSL R5-0449]|uniref:hypothetical protein n=1 Tax=Solibacillus sp. FSL R5-0449 TaxID=2921639 RepID=UPI0030D357A7